MLVGVAPVPLLNFGRCLFTGVVGGVLVGVAPVPLLNFLSSGCCNGQVKKQNDVNNMASIIYPCFSTTDLICNLFSFFLQVKAECDINFMDNTADNASHDQLRMLLN